MIASRTLVFAAAGLLAAAVAACETGRGGRLPDAGTTRLDGSVPRVDGGRDSGPMIRLDAGRDSGGGGFDAGRDSGGGGFDAGRDSGGGGFDAGRDGGRDSGFASCDVGAPCDPARGCLMSPRCIDEGMSTIGTAGSDEILGHPSGAATIPTTTWIGGYCSTVDTLASGGCDPDVEGSCGTCGTCLAAGTDGFGATVTLCARTCVPSLTTNTCRDGYQCDLGSTACLPGCTSSDACAVYREDTNGDGSIDEGPASGGVDRLVYDTDGNWTCNTTTDRCEHDGSFGAEAGDACVKDTDCEANGRCIDEASTDGNWPGGYCLKMGCDVPGNSCAGGGVCDGRAFGQPVCLAPCTVAATSTASDVFSNAADCRAGYTCLWDGTSGAVTDNGVCIPGEYNAVRTANIGATCSDASSCYSPYGLGQCRDWDGTDGPAPGTCTLLDCDAPGVASDVCGTGGVCGRVSSSPTSYCLEGCTAAEDCALGLGCWDTTAAGIDTGGRRVCFAGCLVDADCRTGDTCIGATTTTLGECG